MKKTLPLILFFTFIFCAADFAVAKSEDAEEVVVDLEEINVFDQKESELLDPEWQELELKLAQLKETFEAITKENSVEDVPDDLEEVKEEEPVIEAEAVELKEAESKKIEKKVEKKVEKKIEEKQADLNKVEPQNKLDDEPEIEEKKVSDSVELNGDTVEYSVDRNKVIAEGNVVVINKDVKLTCDRIEFSRDTNLAYATGNVRLVMKKGEASEMTGEQLTFNFKTMKGTFDGAKIYAKPYYGYGGTVSKESDNHMRMKDNYITTCDLDKPHYRLTAKKMDIYPGEKLIARSVRMLIGKIPTLYMPRFTQDLREKEPMVTFTPGFDKEWGIFVLSSWKYKLNDNFKGIIHIDAREKKDLAWGIDANYKTPKFGKGQFRTYYMNERSITSDRFFQERPSPTIEKERFGVEWRHKWKIDKKTDAILQYSKLSDSTFLKDYFKQKSEDDSSPDTFFLLTRTLPQGIASFRTDVRVNRFESAIERLPELRYDLSNQELFGTGLYLRNTTVYSNLTSKTAAPSEARKNTMRVDTDSAISYPMKVGFLEINPFVGGRNTYYSKTLDPNEYGTIRGIFNTGASLSTRFYKVFDTKMEKFGLEINRLRHIITPTVDYRFSSLPTRTKNQLDQFDGIDSLDIAHTINFSIENKLQTKRDDRTVELLRAIISTDFRLKEHQSTGGFDQITTDIDFRPVDWMTFFFDANYDTRRDYLTTANFDMYINGGDKWSASIGKRWNREVDDQLTTSFNYKFNPKWALGTYTRFDLRNGILKEQEFSLKRDLHAWTMDINFNETRNQGNEIWLVFTLKAFPDMVIDFGTSFNKRKAGSQSSEGD